MADRVKFINDMQKLGWPVLEDVAWSDECEVALNYLYKKYVYSVKGRATNPKFV